MWFKCTYNWVWFVVSKEVSVVCFVVVFEDKFQVMMK